jgi:hypothetical protein
MSMRTNAKALTRWLVPLILAGYRICRSPGWSVERRPVEDFYEDDVVFAVPAADSVAMSVVTLSQARSAVGCLPRRGQAACGPGSGGPAADGGYQNIACHRTRCVLISIAPIVIAMLNRDSTSDPAL